MVKVPTDGDLQALGKKDMAQATEELIEQFRDILLQPLKGIEDRFERPFPVRDIEGRVRGLDLDKHKSLLFQTFMGLRAAEVLTGGRVEIPVCSLEQAETVKIDLDYETPKPAGIRFNSGLMWSREENQYSLYLAYIVTHIRDLETFEWLERRLPDAAYFDVYVPSELQDMGLQCELTGSWEDLSEATRRYQIYELVSPKENRYTGLLSIEDVHISFSLNLRKGQLHLRKHMYQGKSMPPTTVLERIGRNEDLVVLTARIPLWMRQRLEKEAKQKGEHLGTHLRNVLETRYDGRREHEPGTQE